MGIRCLRFVLVVAAACAVCCWPILGAERKIDPTFLRRSLADLKETPVDVTTPTCHYRVIFGLGDAEARIPRGVARFGLMTVEAKGGSAETTCPGEEQVYLVLEGSGVLSYGEERVGMGKDDFMYLAPGVRRSIANEGDRPCRVVVMGFRVPLTPDPSPARGEGRKEATARGEGKTEESTRGEGRKASKLQKANIHDVQKQTVASHPPTVLYQLLVGDTKSTRDKIAAGRVLTSLFIMNFAPGGTNFPHHHEREEEIYLVLDGQGEMVAGGGMTGIEGRHPAKAGDAYFFRLNCTVGFYNRSQPGAEARILAVRSLFPFGKP